MLQYNVQRAREAVQYLVDSPYTKHHMRRLRSVVDRPRSMPFTGPAEALNELLVIGRQSKAAMENLLSVAEHKRSSRPSYMTMFMQTKRARERKLIEVEEVALGRRLLLDERVTLVRCAREKWALERKIHVENRAREYEVQFGFAPNWVTSNEFIKDFWQLKDVELDVLLEQSKAFAMRRLHAAKNVVTMPHVSRQQRLPDNLRS